MSGELSKVLSRRAIEVQEQRWGTSLPQWAVSAWTRDLTDSHGPTILSQHK